MPGVIINSLAMLMVIIPSLSCALMLIWSLFGIHITAWIWRGMTACMLAVSCLGMVLLWPELPATHSDVGEVKFYSELIWINAESAKMTSPGILIQFMLDRQRMPMLFASSLLFFCSSWTMQFRQSDISHLRSCLARIMMLAAMQLSLTIFLLADDMISLISATTVTTLLACGLLASWGESERRKQSIEVFGNWMTATIFVSVAILLISTGLASVSPTQGTLTGSTDFSISNLLIRLTRAPLADPLLANAYSQTRPLAFLAIFIGISIWSGLAPFHRWLITLFRQLPLELFGLVTLCLSTGLIVLLTRIAIPFVGETVVAAGAIWLFLAMLSIAYLSLIALAQTELRRLLALSTIRDLLLILVGFLTLLELGTETSWLLGIQLALWMTYLSSLLATFNDRFHELDSACYGGLWQSSPHWSKLWLTGTVYGFGVPLLGMFPSRGLIFLSLCRVQINGILWLLFLFLISELIMSWAWWRVTAAMLWGDSRLPVARGPAFDQLPGSHSTSLLISRPLPATSSILTTVAAGVFLLTSAAAPSLLLQYWDTPGVSSPAESPEPVKPNPTPDSPQEEASPEFRPEGRS